MMDLNTHILVCPDEVGIYIRSLFLVHIDRIYINSIYYLVKQDKKNNTYTRF